MAVGLWLAAIGCNSDPDSGQTDDPQVPSQTAGSVAGQAGAAATPTAGRAGAPAAGTAAGASGRAGNAGGTTAGTTGVAAAGSGAAAGSAASGEAGASGTGSTAGIGGSAAGAGGMGSAGSASEPLGPMQTLIPHPSWDCGMPEGIPGPTGALVFDAVMEVGTIHDIGETQYGYRHQIDITGGTVTGAKIEAEILDRGLDYQLVLANGAVEVEQVNILRTRDGAVIYVRTCGAAATSAGDVRITMDFEAPNSSAYAFLNTGKFVGTRELDLAAKTLKLHVFEAGAPDPANAVQVTQPDGVPNQTWDCKVSMGAESARGAVVYTESVGIGAGSLSVGPSKRGTRNIIPITGGTTEGRVEGTVLSGGADFQIIANGTFSHLDARYSLKTKDGEVIIVRNCGPIGALIPVFEASKAGKHAWLNENDWLSSDPGLGLGAVNLTIYETR